MLLLLPGEISAKALWDALRRRSTKILEEMETETSPVCFKQQKYEKFRTRFIYYSLYYKTDSMAMSMNCTKQYSFSRITLILHIKHCCTVPQQVETMLVDWNLRKRQDHLLRLSGLRFMYLNAQYNQAYSTLLLQQRLQSPLCNLDMTKGPRQYLTADNMLLTE